MNQRSKGSTALSIAWLFCLMGFLLVSCDAPQSGNMTPARFHQIVNTPGDGKPVVGPMAASPFWTNATVHIVMTYASGTNFEEEMPVTGRLVGGKYFVGAMESKYYHQTMYSIVECDPEFPRVKIYSLFGDGHGGESVVDATAVYDLSARTYTTTSSYGDFKETGSGHFTDTEDVSKTLIYKNGALFMTREIEARPVSGGGIRLR